MPNYRVILFITDHRGNKEKHIVLKEGTFMFGRDRTADIISTLPGVAPVQGFFSVSRTGLTYLKNYDYDTWNLNGHSINSKIMALKEDDFCEIAGQGIYVAQIDLVYSFAERLFLIGVYLRSFLVSSWGEFKFRVNYGFYIFLFVATLCLALGGVWIIREHFRLIPKSSGARPNPSIHQGFIEDFPSEKPNQFGQSPEIVADDFEKSLQRCVQLYSISQEPYFFPDSFVNDVYQARSLLLPIQRDLIQSATFADLLVFLLKSRSTDSFQKLQSRVHVRVDQYRRQIGFQTPDQVLLVIMGVYLAEYEKKPDEILRLLKMRTDDPLAQRNVWVLFQKQLLSSKAYQFLVSFFANFAIEQNDGRPLSR